ncbi:LysR substrate-binding domain-containing protein [Mucilaginibacter sp. McL0603]|uniref:hydrogen peroxide-inducible genes activator n=1 Tax=Mucilaginibacter sp. McL0603 TaxID=3415670 RepID=UPI003CE6A94B
MTIIQLKYIIAIDTYRHFVSAAENCFVSQPTLSMQLQKAEDELGVRIFDRSKQPLIPTEVGAELIEQARKIIAEMAVLDEIVNLKKGIISGELKVGIIPTLAPYLLPLFMQSFTEKYPRVKLVISEMTTAMITENLRQGKIDMGLLVTPLDEPGIKEYPLFYEELMAFVSKRNAKNKKTYILPCEIDPAKLWMLEEGHCFRNQIENLCELKKANNDGCGVRYESGSIETLRRMVDTNDGITILPELATTDMTEDQLAQVWQFSRPAPMREVSAVVHRDFIKGKLIELVKKEILLAIPEKIKSNQSNNVIPVTL